MSPNPWGHLVVTSASLHPWPCDSWFRGFHSQHAQSSWLLLVALKVSCFWHHDPVYMCPSAFVGISRKVSQSNIYLYNLDCRIWSYIFCSLGGNAAGLHSLSQFSWPANGLLLAEGKSPLPEILCGTVSFVPLWWGMAQGSGPQNGWASLCDTMGWSCVGLVVLWSFRGRRTWPSRANVPVRVSGSFLTLCYHDLSLVLGEFLNLSELVSPHFKIEIVRLLRMLWGLSPIKHLALST